MKRYRISGVSYDIRISPRYFVTSIQYHKYALSDGAVNRFALVAAAGHVLHFEHAPLAKAALHPVRGGDIDSACKCDLCTLGLPFVLKSGLGESAAVEDYQNQSKAEDPNMKRSCALRTAVLHSVRGWHGL